MGQIAEMVMMVARRALKHGENLTRGITSEIAARQPMGLVDGRPTQIVTNHPTFVYGHLSLYPVRLWTLRGLDPGRMTPTTEWMDLFKAGSPCLDDPQGTIYPAWPVILERFRAGFEEALGEMPSVPDEVFFRENPDPKSRESFPTVGMALTVLFGSHLTMHFGQVSAWRRFFGLPSAT